MKRSSIPLSVTMVGLLLQACGGSQPPSPAPSQPAPVGAPATPAAPPVTSGPQKDLPLTAYAVAWGAFEVPARLRPKEETTVRVTLKNASKVAWPGGAGTSGLKYTIRLSYRWLREDKEVVPYGNLRAELPSVVNPGQEVAVDVVVTAPPTKGSYRLQFDLLHEGVAFFEGMGADTKVFDVQVGT